MTQHQRVFNGRIVAVDVGAVTLPNGTQANFEIVRHPGGAAIVAVDAKRRVCLLNQWRPAVDRWICELPAGKLEPGDDPRLTAERELQEESGIHARHWQSLGAILSSPGVFTEVVHLYLATGLDEVTARPEAHEVFTVGWEPLDAACTRALAGEIVDSKTVIGLLRAQAALR
jgi:ADP-ribose pyrophosphatase